MYNKLLVVGSARGGTTFLSRLLTRLGLEVKQEGIRPNRGGFAHQVEISHGANGRVLEAPDNYFVAHQLRHPINVIRRYMFTFFQDPKKIDAPVLFYNLTFDNQIPIPPPIKDNLKIVCEVFCRWNKLAESQMAKLPTDRVMQYRVEDMNTEIYNLMSAIGIELDTTKTTEILAEMGNKTHTRSLDIPNASLSRPWIEGDGLFKHIGFDDVTSELQDYILELGYDKEA